MTYTDPASVAGATLPIDERVPLLVIGAGPAGLAAALAAAEAGTSVMLIDENPIPYETMGDDVPLFFGGRMGAAIRNRSAMTEALLAARPDIERAFDAGIDVRLGTTCWGLYAKGPSTTWLPGPGPVAGLSDGERSWLVQAERIIVATGRRDMGLAFDGWAQPGVMGMEAAIRLARDYGALDVRRAVVLGTTAEARVGAALLEAAGVVVAALVEPGPTPLTPGPSLTGHSITEAEAGPDGVTAAILQGPDGPVRIECDAIILAVAAIPQIELLDSANCRIAYDPARGGHAPTLDATGQTTIPGLYAAGDCAGIWPAKSRDPAIAAAEGHAAALAFPAGPAPATADDPGAYRLAWVRAALLGSRTDPHVCQCEEVTARDILEVRPPRYLGAEPNRRNTRTLAALLGNGPPNPDQVKRLTRAGMGLCQGRRCREQVAALLALETGLPLAEIPLATHRAPVRPMALRLAAATAEDPGIAKHWDVWFAMKSQYLAPWDLPQHYTVATRGQGPLGTE